MAFSDIAWRLSRTSAMPSLFMREAIVLPGQRIFLMVAERAFSALSLRRRGRAGVERNPRSRIGLEQGRS